MSLRWTAPALRDLEEIGDYIARDNAGAAARTVTTILNLADLLRLSLFSADQVVWPERASLLWPALPISLLIAFKKTTYEFLPCCTAHGGGQANSSDAA